MAAGGCKPRQEALERQRAARCRRRRSRENHATHRARAASAAPSRELNRNRARMPPLDRREAAAWRTDGLPWILWGLSQPPHMRVSEGHPVLAALCIFNFLLMKLFLEFLCIQKKILRKQIITRESMCSHIQGTVSLRQE